LKTARRLQFSLQSGQAVPDPRFDCAKWGAERCRNLPLGVSITMRQDDHALLWFWQCVQTLYRSAAVNDDAQDEPTRADIIS